MTQVNDCYSQLSARSRAAAAEQVLENVRQKHLTAAASWDRLAHTDANMERLRMKRLAADAAALGGPTRAFASGIAGEEKRDER